MEAGCETESIKGNRQGSESQSVKGFPQRLRRRLKRSSTGPAAARCTGDMTEICDMFR